MTSSVYNPLTVQNEEKQPLLKNPNFWKWMNRIMYILAIILFFGLGFGISFVVIDLNMKSYCSQPTCVKIGAEFLSSMDIKTDPCDDFFEFSCGNIFKYSSIAPEMTNKKYFDRQYSQILEILNEPIAEDDPLFVKNSKFMFSSCINLNDGVFDSDLIVKDLGGWPIVEHHHWQESAFNWTEFDMNCHKIGIVNAAFINFNFTRDEKSNLILMLTAPNFARDGNSNDDLATVNAVALSLKAPVAQTDREIPEAFELRQKLANDSCESLCQVTIQNLTVSYPQINWVEYIKQILPNNVNVDVNQTINVDMQYLDNLFQTIDTVSKRVQANYAISQVIVDLAKKITTAFLKPYIPFWKQCIQHTYPVFHNAIHYMHRRKFLQLNSEKKISGIIQNVKNELMKSHIKVKWPECEAQADDVCTQLVPKMTPSLKKLFDKAENDVFANVSMDEGKFFHNILKIEKRAKDRFISLKKIFETYQLENTPKIEMAPSPIFFQDPLYIDDGFDYMNYGSFGGFIGSLMMKKLESCSPIQNQKANHDLCIAAQYKSQTESMNKTAEKNLHWQAAITMGNHIGLEAAYSAYINSMAVEQTIRGLNYSTKQLFWISSARALCMDKFSYAIDENIDVPFKFQFNSFFASIPAFVDDFNCPIKSNMNPETKCREIN